MKKIIATAAALTFSAGMAMADPVVGTWKTEPGDTGGYLHVAVSKCGGAICGTIKNAFDKSGSAIGDYEHKGKKMIWDMQAQGEGYYKGGKIWAADRDKTYKSKMTLSGNTLDVQGCVLGICRGQAWSRVN